MSRNLLDDIILEFKNKITLISLFFYGRVHDVEWNSSTSPSIRKYIENCWFDY